jgi:alpha-methylacyl-CoA racemase
VSGPLAGVRVLELPALGPVPFAGMLLADLGAEVVRIDRLRGTEAGFDFGFAAGPLGRGRRSIALDLRAPGGAEVALRLAAPCDALIEGFRPGVAERLGIGPADVHARNPKLVYGRMTGWGQDGPLAATAGHDITYLAVAGVLHGIGPAARPVPPVNYVADFGGGAMFLVSGLLAALLHAQRTGEGQVLDAAMTEGAGYLATMTRTFFGAGGWQDARESNLLDGGYPHYRCYECADGRFVAVGPLEPKFWAALCEAIGADAATAPSPYDSAQHEACTALLESTFRSRTRDEWAALFAPLDGCVAPVLTLAEAPEHPHNRARGSFVDVGGIVVGAPAPRFSATPAAATGLTELGGATDELLREAGYSADEIADLRERAVVG